MSEPANPSDDDLVEEPKLPPIRGSALTVAIPASTDPVAAVKLWRPFVERRSAGSKLLLINDAVEWPAIDVPNVRIVRHVQPLGSGGCLQTAVLSIDTPISLLLDPLRNWNPSQVEALIEEIDHAEIVAGCRAIGTPPAMLVLWDFVRLLGARIFLGYTPESRLGWPGWRGQRRRWAARRGFGVPLTDPDAGLLLVRTERIRAIPIQSPGRFAWTELVAKANHLEAILAEVGILFEENAETRQADAASIARDAWRVFRDPDFGPPPRKTS